MAEENVVQQFERLTMQLVQEAVSYFGKGVFDEETDANIRKLRTLLPVLSAAISQNVFRPPPPSPQMQTASIGPTGAVGATAEPPPPPSRSAEPPPHKRK